MCGCHCPLYPKPGLSPGRGGCESGVGDVTLLTRQKDKNRLIQKLPEMFQSNPLFASFLKKALLHVRYLPADISLVGGGGEAAFHPGRKLLAPEQYSLKQRSLNPRITPRGCMQCPVWPGIQTSETFIQTSSGYIIKLLKPYHDLTIVNS